MNNKKKIVYVFRKVRLGSALTKIPLREAVLVNHDSRLSLAYLKLSRSCGRSLWPAVEPAEVY